MTARNQFDPEDRLERCRRMYRAQQDGLSCRAIVYEHMSREGVSESTAWRDWDQVKKWNEEDWAGERENVVARLTSLRFRAIEKAMRKGQLMVASTLMAQLGATVQETESLAAGTEAVNLNIQIEDKRHS